MKRSGQFCKPLRESDIFDDCSSRLNPEHYFESCRKDMCECTSGKCYCDSFSAYAHECKRVGGFISDQWRRETGCEYNSTSSIINQFGHWMSTSQATNQLNHHRLHHGRQRSRQRFHGSNGALRYNHYHRRHYPSASYGLDASNFPLQSASDHDQMFLNNLSQHVPRELRLQNHSRTPPPLV